MEQKAKKQGVLSFLWRHSGGQKGWLALSFVTTLASVVASFLMPQVIRFTVDSVLGSEAPAPLVEGLLGFLGGAESLRTSLIGCAVAVMALALLSGLFNFIARAGLAKGTETFARNLRDGLYRHIQYLPFKWHVDNMTGEIIQRCTSDMEVVRNFIATNLLEVARTLLLILVALALMVTMNLQLSLVALIYVPVILLYSTFFYRLVGQRFLRADEAEGELTSIVQENLTGVRVVRAFGRERFEMDRFDRYNNRFADLWIRLGNVLSNYWAVGDVVTGLQILSVVVAGAALCANGQLTLGEYQVFVVYNQMLAWPVRTLGHTLSTMSQTGVSATRIQEILDAEEETPEPEAKKPDLATDITFENVTFSYDGAPVLKDLSFTIPAGSTFGILGATGSGKSTITYLLNRLYDLPEGFGSIRFGDVDIRDIDRYYLRRNVGIVLQEPFLFSKTIGENIAVTVPDANMDEICAAARVADLHETVQQFNEGYGTTVGERGLTLSGGQKQRVAIARTLLTGAPVMVFDDSLSAVDLGTDARIRDALREGKGEATLLLISHRINTLMTADQILVLEEGRMTALGSHEQLIRRDGPYKRIYEMQSEAALYAGETLSELGTLPELGSLLEDDAADEPAPKKEKKDAPKKPGPKRRRRKRGKNPNPPDKP